MKISGSRLKGGARGFVRAGMSNNSVSVYVILCGL